MAKPNPLSQGLSKQARPASVVAVPSVSSTEAPPAAKARTVPASRVGRVLIGGHFAPEVQTQIKVLAATERCTVQELVEEGLNAVFARRHLPQIANLSPRAAQADTTE